MGYLTDADWWWEIALQGIISSIIGAVLAGLTAALILRTSIEREAKARREAKVEERTSKVYDALPRIQQMALIGRHSPLGYEDSEFIEHVLGSMAILASSARRDDPTYAGIIDAWCDHLAWLGVNPLFEPGWHSETAADDRHSLLTLLSNLRGDLMRRMASADAFTQLDETTAAEIVAGVWKWREWNQAAVRERRESSD